MKLFFIFIFIFLSNSLNAEYRVYQYYIRSAYESPHDQDAYLVTSTIDPVSYKAYHGGSEAIQIDLLRTWKCEGFTGDAKRVCPSPGNNQLPEETTI